MKKNLLILVIVLIFFLGCSLKRTNPLDPNSHDISIPSDITGIEPANSSAHTDNHWVRLSWDKVSLQSADGYYIYRGQSYNGTYQRVKDLINPPSETDSTNTVTWTDSPIVPGYYFYKLSSYKKHGNPPRILEGHLSQWVPVNVPQ